MTKLQFAKRAFYKCKTVITSITDNSAQADQFETVYEDALKKAIQDVKTKEFESPVFPNLVYDLENDKNPFKGSRETASFYIYDKPENVVTYIDSPIKNNALPSGFSFGFINSRNLYYPFYSLDDDRDYIASPQKEHFSFQALVLKKNLKLWSQGALECAITFCAFLLSPILAKTDPQMLLNEYESLKATYRVGENLPSRYEDEVSSYDPIFGPNENFEFERNRNLPF